MFFILRFKHNNYELEERKFKMLSEQNLKDLDPNWAIEECIRRFVRYMD